MLGLFAAPRTGSASAHPHLQPRVSPVSHCPASASRLVRRPTGSSAALPAGTSSPSAYRIDHYAHLQLQQTQFIPLALWAFHRPPTPAVRTAPCLSLRRASCCRDALRHLLIPTWRPCADAVDREPPHAEGTLSRSSSWRGSTAAAGRRPTCGPGRGPARRRGRTEQRDVAQPSGAPEVNAVYGKVARFREPSAGCFDSSRPPSRASACSHTKHRERHEKQGRHDDGGRGWARPDARVRRVAGLQRCDLPRAMTTSLLFKALRIPARMGLMVGFSLAVLAGTARRASRRACGGERAPGVLTVIGADARRVCVDAAPPGARAAAGELRRIYATRVTVRRQ